MARIYSFLKPTGNFFTIDTKNLISSVKLFLKK